MADWGDGVSASCVVGPIVRYAGNEWPHNALRHHWFMPISCHFRDCKALLVTSLTHVSGAIASVQTLYLYLYVANRKVFRDCLKLFPSITGFRKLSGREFQTDMPATEKASRP